MTPPGATAGRADDDVEVARIWAGWMRDALAIVDRHVPPDQVPPSLVAARRAVQRVERGERPEYPAE